MESASRPMLLGGGPFAPTAMVSRLFSEGVTAPWKSEGKGTGCAQSPVRGVWTRASELSGERWWPWLAPEALERLSVERGLLA